MESERRSGVMRTKHEKIGVVLTSLVRSAILLSLAGAGLLKLEDIEEEANRRLGAVRRPEIDKKQLGFHLKVLKEAELVIKESRGYRLTKGGEELINQLTPERSTYR